MKFRNGGFFLTVWQAIIMGAIQGLTEFLPISSSGHLVIFGHLFNLTEPPLVFGIIVHLGTLFAVFVCFWPDIWAIIKKPFSRITGLLIIACIPAAIAGYFLEPLINQAFSSLLVVGLGLIYTGAILTVSELMTRRSLDIKEARETSTGEALFIGIMQAIAVIPGVSRSGSTIAAGLMVGLNRSFAARFSFLLSIPIILGAAVFELKDFYTSAVFEFNWVSYGAGLVSAAVFGYLAIRLVIGLIKQGKLSKFSYYCWAVGLLAVAGHFYF